MYKTDYFVRFVQNKSQARRDLRRGYSFSSYVFLPTKKETREYWEENGVENPGLARCDQGWGLKLDGLCGFGPFETIEEAESYAREKKGYAGVEWPAAAIYTGSHIGSVADGDLFRPAKLEKIILL